jgi:hypothetical protein
MRACRRSQVSARTRPAIRPIPMRPFSSAPPMSRCVRWTASISMIGWSGPFQSLSTAVFFTGNFFVNGPAVGGYSLYVCHRKGIPGSTSPIQEGLIPPTQQQVANFVGGLPASDPKSVEAHTNPVGTTGTTQPADTTISQAVTPTEMPTTVKPKPVPCRRYRRGGQRSRLRPARRSRTRNSRRRPRRRRQHAESGRLDDAAGRNPSDDLLCRRLT